MSAVEHLCARLRDRAESYSRDASVLHDDGDRVFAAAFRGLADELRSAAADLERTFSKGDGSIG